MRFRDALIAAFVAALPLCAAGATPEQVRAGIATRLQQQLPDLAIQDLAAGSAALDEDLRAQEQQNAAAGAPLVEAGRKLWTAKFRDGKSLAGCFPNAGR